MDDTVIGAAAERSGRWTRRRLFTLVGILVLVVVAVYLYGRPFDPTAWQAPDVVYRRDRAWMVNDLRLRHLRGLNREQVVALLGPPDDPAPWRANPDRRDYPKWDLFYCLGGYDIPFVIGPGIMEALVIRFGPDGRVNEHRVGPDWKFR